MSEYQNLVAVTQSLIGGTAMLDNGEIVYMIMAITAIHAEKGIMMWFLAHDKNGKIGKYQREEITMV